MSPRRAAIFACAALSLVACTEQEVYDSATDLRVQDCGRERQEDERLACEARARIPYEEADKKHQQAADPQKTVP